MAETKIAYSILLLILPILFHGSGASSSAPLSILGLSSGFVANHSFSGAAASPSALSVQLESVRDSSGTQHGSLSLSNSSATVLCSTQRTSSGKVYISGFFPAGNQHHTAFEVAFDKYIQTELDTQGRGATCIVYPSVEKAQFTLERWKQEEMAGAGSHQLIETGWVYKGCPNGRHIQLPDRLHNRVGFHPERGKE